MVAQCTDPDTMPAESYAFVRSTYKMFIQHEVSDSFIFNVNITSIPVASELYIGGVREGDTVVIDEDGILEVNWVTGIILAEEEPVLQKGQMWLEIL